MMLYRTLKRMIERGRVEAMAQKLDIFLAADKITAQEYQELRQLMGAAQA